MSKYLERIQIKAIDQFNAKAESSVVKPMTKALRFSVCVHLLLRYSGKSLHKQAKEYYL